MTLPAPKPASHTSVMLPGQTLTLIGWLATVAAAIGFLWWGVSDWIVASANRVGGIDDRAPANTLDWARFDKVWMG